MTTPSLVTTRSGASMRDDIRVLSRARRELQRSVDKEADQENETDQEAQRRFSREERARKRERSKRRGWTRLDQVRQGGGLALAHRKAIEDGDFSVFRMAFVFAVAKDFIFDILPIIGIFFGAFVSFYLFVFLWGKGKWTVRIVIFFLLWICDMLPAAKLIPFSTLSVLYVYQQAKKHAARMKEELAAAGVTI